MTNPVGAVRADYVNGVDASNGYVYSERTFDSHALTIGTADGYDNVTGIGSPNGTTWLSALDSYPAFQPGS